MTKMISVRDDVYHKLSAIKGGDSFSDLLDRLFEVPRDDIMSFAGILKNDPKTLKAMECAYRESRKMKMKRVEF